MNKKIIVSIFVGTVVIIGGLIWLGQPVASQNSSPTNSVESLLKSNENNFDFGTISMAKGNVSHVFTVANTGTEPIVVKKLYTSCMCTTATLTNDGKTVGPFGMPGHASIPSIDVTIAPGATAQVNAVFDPAAHGPAGIGTISRVVVLENSAGKPVEIGFSANVTP